MEDVIVIGGGPAGSAAARLLALWGHSVTLLTRPPVRGQLAESLPPSCSKLFDVIGATAAIDSAGFIASTGNTVWWGGEERVGTFAPGTYGWQVDRDRFDAVMLGLALAAGAEVNAAATVRTVISSADACTVRYDSEAGNETADARWVLDCSGRAGVAARRWRNARAGGAAGGMGFTGAGRDVRESGRQSARTLALLGSWDRGAWDVADESHTLVESYEGGWAWSVPISATRRCVAVMVDPSLTHLDGRDGLLDAYRAELRKTSRLFALLERAVLVDAPWACDASPYTSGRVSDGRVLAAGDAASFVDPLSSFGVKKALASAWLAAVVIHSCIEEPDIETVALQLYETRERTMYESLQRQSAEFSQRAATEHAHDFWSERSDAGDELGQSGEPDIAALRRDPAVLDAFAALKQADAITLRPAADVRHVDLAVVRGNRIALATHLVADAFPHGIRFLRDVDLVKLSTLAPEWRQVPELYDAYNRAAPPVPLPDFLGALSTLIGKRLLHHA